MLIARFVLIADAHIDNVLWLAPGAPTPASIVAYINSLSPAPDFTIDLGDLCDICSAAHFEIYEDEFGLIAGDKYRIPGNHDECFGGCAINPLTCLTAFEAEIGNRHPLSRVVSGYKFISIFSKYWPVNKGSVDAAERAYLEAELVSAGSRIPIVFAHHPISEITDGHDELEALLLAYNVKAYFSGHLHTPLSSALVDGTYHVNCDQVLPILASGGGMAICDVYSTGIDIDYVRAAPPWDRFYKLFVPCGNGGFMSLVTIAELRAQVKSSLTDAQLQAIIDREEAEVIRLFGVHYTDVAQTITETLEGGEKTIYLRRPIVSITSITEDGTLVDPLSYRVWPAQGKIRKISGVQAWLAGDDESPLEWGEVLIVVYKPADDNLLRKAVIIDLARIALSRTGMQSESFAGEYSYTAAQWDDERSKILRRLKFPSAT
jgi:hypothetical protein